MKKREQENVTPMYYIGIVFVAILVLGLLLSIFLFSGEEEPIEQKIGVVETPSEQALFENIIRSNQVERCTELQNNELKDYCALFLTPQEPSAENKALQTILVSGKKEDCQSLSVENAQFCEQMFLAKEQEMTPDQMAFKNAISYRNKDYCFQIEEELLKDFCLQSFEDT